MITASRLRTLRGPKVLHGEGLGDHAVRSRRLELGRGPFNRAVAGRRTGRTAADAVAQLVQVLENLVRGPSELRVREVQPAVIAQQPA